MINKLFILYNHVIFFNIDVFCLQFSNLTTLIFGGEHLTTAEINSVDLTMLCFKVCIVQ